MKWLAALMAAFALFTIPLAARQADPADTALALRTAKAAIGHRLPDLTFTDDSGKPFRFADTRGKPLIVSMIYTGCTDICPLIVEHLYKAVALAQDAFGKDSFTVVTIGFDTAHDTPQRMRSFARAHGADLPNWYFLAAGQNAIDALSTAVGFSFLPSAGGFDHMAQVTLADADGTVYAQVFGGDFAPQAIIEPLKELVFGSPRPASLFASISQRIRLFCTVYNPNTGRYYFNYSLFIALAIGFVCIVLVTGWLIREFRRSGRAA